MICFDFLELLPELVMQLEDHLAAVAAPAHAMHAFVGARVRHPLAPEAGSGVWMGATSLVQDRLRPPAARWWVSPNRSFGGFCLDRWCSTRCSSPSWLLDGLRHLWLFIGLVGVQDHNSSQLLTHYIDVMVDG